MTMLRTRRPLPFVRPPCPRVLAALSPALQQGQGPLAQLVRSGQLYCVFQPLADLREGTVYAHEALIRGPQGSPWHTPDVLLDMARQEHLLQDFELVCAYTALQGWGAARAAGRIFINISADALVQAVALCGADTLARTVRTFGVQPRMVVLEITEHERVSDMARLRQAVQCVHGAGMRLALDDFGDGRSSLRVWSEVKPDFVKIDKYFVRNISAQPQNLQMVQAIKSIAQVFGTTLVAEGIETPADLRALRDLDIAYGQGWLLGYPDIQPVGILPAEALTALQDRRVAVLPQLAHQSARPGILRHVPVLQAPTLTPDTVNDTVAACFQNHENLHALAIVEDGRPVALINRQQFMTHYATLYFREVHGRKPCLGFANVQPRVVERDCDVEQLLGILTSQDQRYLSDGFIVTANGRYIGLGTGEQLVRTVTEARIEAARHANPLTFLPGNIPISLHITRLLENQVSFVACYADLNHFKPFNDQYGYWRGDEMIRLLARVITTHANAERDFVGHVGGDDFLVLFQSQDWLPRCQAIVEEFGQQARLLFDADAQAAGGIHAEDRYGVERFFPCTTVSVGAACIAPGQTLQAEDVANLAALAKHDAKHRTLPIVVHESAPAPTPQSIATRSPAHLHCHGHAHGNAHAHSPIAPVLTAY